MTTTLALYTSSFTSQDGWEYEAPAKEVGEGRYQEQALWASAGRWWSPHIVLQPFHAYQINARAKTSGRLYWAAKHFDADGKMLDADHYSAFSSDDFTDYTSFFRVPPGAATTRILFDGIKGVGYTVDAVSLHQAELPALEAWWRELLSPWPPFNLSHPADRWQLLPRTHGIIGEGGRLRVVMLGDSIINDTSNSVFELPLAVRQGVQWEVVSSVRGSTGCGYYIDHLGDYVERFEPDLVIIGGRSQTDSLKAISQVVSLLAPKHDVLLMSNGFPKVTEEDGTEWQSDCPPNADDYSTKLAGIAAQQGVAYLEFEGILHAYIDNHGLDAGDFMRDAVHTGDLGRAFYAQVLGSYFSLS